MPNYVYVGAAPWIAATKDAPTGGLYRLDTDNGRWERLAKGLPDAVEARCVVADPRTPGTVYAGTQDGPYLSSDGGDTWRRLALPGNNRLTWSIALDPADPRTLYVGTQGTTMY